MTEPADDHIAATLLALAAERAPDRTACPSEAARRLSPASWREVMPAVRRTALTLARQGSLELSQRGRPVSADSVRGAFRIALPCR